MKNIRVAGSCVTGKRHSKDNIVCQDKIFSKSFNGISVITLADGAGGYSIPEIGAEISTKYISEFLCSNFEDLYQKGKEEINQIILEGLQHSLIKKADELSVLPQELSSTLLFVGVNDNRYLGGHIGDGMIGYFDKNKRPKTLSHPDNDENGRTYLTTQLDLLDHFRIYKGGLNDIKGFVLMSDGLFDSLFDKTKNNLFGENTTIFEYLNHHSAKIKEIEKIIQEDIKTNLLQLSEKGDDCSIILMSLVERDKKLKRPKKPDLVLDEKELTMKINQLESSFNALNISFQKIEKKVSNLKTIKGDTGPPGSKGDKGSTGSQGPQGVKGKAGVAGHPGPPGAEGATGNVELESILQWEKNVKIWLIILSVALVGLGGILAKLLFFS